MNVYRSAPQTGNEPLNGPLNQNAHLKKKGDGPLNGPLNPKNSPKKRDDEPLNEPLKVIYDAICESPGIQAPTIVGKVGKGLTTVKRAISKLKELGKIEFRGSLKTGGYYPIEKA